MAGIENLDEFLKDKTINKELYKYALKHGYIEKGEAVPSDEELVAEAIEEKGECVFYFSNNSAGSSEMKKLCEPLHIFREWVGVRGL